MSPLTQSPVKYGAKHFNTFLVGQTISCLGTAFTQVALPLLIFRLSSSSLALALATAVTFLPPVLFGLFIGVWTDRLDRRSVMIFADSGRAFAIMLLPLLMGLHILTVPLIYVVIFLSSFLAMCFETCQFSTVVSLVPSEELVQANGRLSASFTAATLVGYLLAGVLVLRIELPLLFLLDALSFLLSVGSLLLIPVSFNPASTESQPRLSLWNELWDGLRLVWSQSLLRFLILLLVTSNFMYLTLNAQIVFFARQKLGASDAQISGLFAASSIGVIICSLAAAHLKRRWSFHRLIIGSLAVLGLITILLALQRSYWVALPLWTLLQGCEALYDIAITSLIMPLIPPEMMGRATSVIKVLAWITIPVGTIFWGWIIALTDNVAITYALIGGLMSLTALLFIFTPVGRAEQATSIQRAKR